MDLERRAFNEPLGSVVDFPAAAQTSEQWHQDTAKVIPMLQHRVEVSQRPIANKHFDMLGELPGQVAGRYAAN